MKYILDFCGFKMAGKIVLPGTNKITELPDSIIRKCEKLARKL